MRVEVEGDEVCGHVAYGLDYLGTNVDGEEIFGCPQCARREVAEVGSVDDQGWSKW